MRSNKSPREYFSKIKKKPALQAILDNLPNMSVDDINKCGQPLWIRTELLTIKEMGTVEERMSSAEDIANVMEHIPGDIPLYYVYQYSGSDFYCPIEVKTGNIWTELNQNGMVKIGYHPCFAKPKDKQQLLANSSYLGQMSMLDYNRLVQSKLSAIKHSSLPVIDITSTKTEAMLTIERYGVKIQ